MSKENKNETQEQETAPAVETKRETAIVVIPIYKKDAETLGFKIEGKNPVQNAEIRNKVRETLGLPLRTRVSGVNAELRVKLGLPETATQNEINKAMKQKILGL